MKQVSCEAVIYKIYKYSDQSAIAMAFTLEFGKIKLFIPKAFTKKGGIMTFIPGSLNFKMKHSSDLHRFESFDHNPLYYHYSITPEITFRLHLIFDYFNNLFDVGQISKSFWKLCQAFNHDNYRKVSIYTVYRLLKESGSMFSPICPVCNTNTVDVHKKGGFYCKQCEPDGEHLDKEIMDIILIMEDNESFKKITVTREEEIDTLKVFNKHMNSISGKTDTIKSFKIFLTVA